MKAWIALFCTFVGLVPIKATAQTFVQAGEHNSFTRVVTQLPDGAGWTAVQEGRRVTLTLSNFDQGFDTGRVFDLIPRDRLARVESQSNQLTLQLDCDCRVAVFDVTGGYVALDILSPGARPTATLLPLTKPQPFAPVVMGDGNQVPSPEALPIRGSKPDRFAQQDVSPPSLPVPNLLLADLPRPRAVTPPVVTPVQSPADTAPSTLGRDVLDPEAQQLLLEIQGRLSRELGTAATRGVLEPRGPSALPNPTRPQIDTRLFADDLHTPAQRLTPTQPGQNVSNIRISTSMDLPDSPIQLRDRVSISGIVCPSADTFDLTNWADESPFDAQVSPLRQALFGEFDRLDPEVARRLARTYLSFGFGAEARQVLMLDDDLSRQEHLLMAMTEILEDGHSNPTAPLRDLIDCASDTALWAIMANQTLPADTPINPDAALLALSKLPVHLRRIVAPGLSDRLLAFGETDAAATALRSLERLPEALPPEATLAQAKVLLKTGENQAGKAQLNDVIEAGAAPSPEALIVLIDEKIANDQPIDAMTAGLAEAYAKELRDTTFGPALQRAHVLALMKSGQFDRAFDAAGAFDDNNSEAASDLRIVMLRELTKTASDMVFLDHVFQQPDSDVSALPRKDRLELIERLFDLGFAQSAQRLISTLPDQPPHPPSRILSARIALALDQPMQAQTKLADIEGEEADVLRARAKRQAGAHAEAHDLFTRGNQEWDAIQAAWLAEDWQALTSPDAPVFGPLVTLATNAPQQGGADDGMLARSGAMLEESGAARQTILDFLDAPQLNLSPPDATE